ncbi:Topoisomerase 1-associated factor 1 [Apiotrichum porosum]|uniref:Topoisomerase 1-associated factor 1 n=1 Tax=Apiotrichum porosum TaxID=105984 RepID=A0A427XWY0_9TREE|nr:Topoisomerase 1-associated factor 1 [Apiotrichum porosum]RSH83343.1 Topoisomerase 1-associated factor 1 [Apiotrichum porosum]
MSAPYASSDHGIGFEDDDDDARDHGPPDMMLGDEEDRFEVFMPAVQSLVNALGGYEQVLNHDTRHFETIYRPGDSVLPVLKDLKKLWRKDDTDDERTVARCMAKAGLMKELLALVKECTSRGDWGRKVSLMAFDLIAALTWPIDVAKELQEMNEEEVDVVTDYASLLRAQVQYKTLRQLLILILPCFAKQRRDEKEERIISLGLHIVRNLLSIKDIVAEDRAIGDKEELSTLQSTLIAQLDEFTYLELIVTLASNANKTEFNQYNMLVLDMVYLLFRSIKPENLAQDQKRAPMENLVKLLEEENLAKARKGKHNTRHSRFGTTITVRTGSQKVILHSQSAITASAGKLLDESKRRTATKIKKVDELMVDTILTPEVITVLQDFARQFLDTFNIRPADSLRTLFVARFAVQYILVLRTKALTVAEKDAKHKQDNGEQTVMAKVDSDLPLGLVAAMTELDAVRWVASRMKTSMDDKAWTELQASIDCFSHISSIEEDTEVSEILQNQLYYNGDILDASLQVVAGYTTQSLGYLESIVHFAYVLLRMLDKYSKNKTFMFMRKRKASRKKRLGAEKAKAATDGEAPIPEEYAYSEEEDNVPDKEAPSYAEHAFTFAAFEKVESVTNTLLAYLMRYRTFNTNEQLRRVVGLMHRQVVKAGAESLYFTVPTLYLFRSILDDQPGLPKGDSARDLVQTINFILRKFFKRMADDPFLMVEALTPKSRSSMKSYDHDEHDDGMAGQRDRIREKFIKNKNIPWSQQMGIAIAMVTKKDGGLGWINEILDLLDIALAGRQEIMMSVLAAARNANPDDSEDEDDEIRNLNVPSKEAVDKFQQQATKRDPHLRLMLRLLHFDATDVESVDEQTWFLPALVLPSAIEMAVGAVRQFLSDPADVDDEKAVLRKVRAPQKRARAIPEYDSDGEEIEIVRPPRKRKQAEIQTFKSAMFIEDSDDDEEADAAFFAREALLRAEMEELAQQRGTATMLATGTKKRKRKAKQVPAVQDEDDEPVEPVEEDMDEEEEEPIEGQDEPMEADDEDDEALPPTRRSRTRSPRVADPDSDVDSPARARPRLRTQRVIDPDDDDE